MHAVADLAARIAHGVGTRKDLPIPFAAALGGAVVALVASFVALGALWKQPRLTGGRGRSADLDAVSPYALDAPWFRWLLRGRRASLAHDATSSSGCSSDRTTPSTRPRASLYVLFWVGTLVVASALLGPVWRS